MPHTSAAYGIYNDDATMQHVVRTLTQSGFAKEDICMLFSPRHPMVAAMRDASILTGDSQASAGAADLMSWLMKLGAVMIPNVSLFVRSPAFLSALVKGKDSSSAYSDIRTLIDLGFSEDDALRYEEQLREMGVLIYVACPEKTRSTEAVEVLRGTGALETASLGKPSALEAAA